MIRIRKRLLLGISIIGVISLSGCNLGAEKEDLKAQVDSLLLEVIENEGKIEEYERTIQALSGVETFPTAISDTTDGSGKQTFNSIGGKILFTKPLEYPGSSQAANTSNLRLSDRITIRPSDNWVIQLNGTTTKYTHPSGVYGTIKVVKIEETVKTKELKEGVVEEFVKNVPHMTAPEYRDIYVSELSRGVQVTLDILNNSKPAIVKCGVCGLSDSAFVYSFYYDGDRDANKSELIGELIRSMTFGSQNVAVDT